MKTKILLFLFTIALFSCAKKGCIDSHAQNYSSKAKKSDGSCTYKQDVIFWQNQAVADSNVADGITTLYFYINGSMVGSCGADVYFTGLPGCSETGIFKYSVDMGKNSSSSLTYDVKDEDGFSWQNGTVNLSANSCSVITLD